MKYFVLIIGLSMIVFGCGPMGPTKHKQTGLVSFNGAALSEGAIVFEDKTSGSAERIELKADGTYEVQLLNGTFQVSVEPLLIESKSKVEGPPDYQYKKVGNIPEKYRSASTSGLKHTVSGPGTFDVKMNK